MPKKPDLRVVDPSRPTVPPPPSSLGKTGATLWRSITTEYRIDDSGGHEMLRQICFAADRAAECAEAIERDGAMIKGKNGLRRDHPLLKHELSARSFVVRSLHRLGLDIEPTRDGSGRPPGSFNWK